MTSPLTQSIIRTFPQPQPPLLTWQSNVPRYVASQLYNVGQVVLIPGVVLPWVGLKQVVSCNILC